MQFIQARTAANKLEVKEGFILAIDNIEFWGKGFLIYVSSIVKKENKNNSRDSIVFKRYSVYYEKKEDFDKEWIVLDVLPHWVMQKEKKDE